MPLKKKYISVPESSIKALSASMNVSRATVYNALNYTTNSETAQQIRRIALSTYGGIEATKLIW